MRIDINDTYYIESDAYNFILVREKEIKKGEHAGEMRKEILGYFGSLETIFRIMPKRLLREANACGLREIQCELKRIEMFAKQGLQNINKEIEQMLKERGKDNE